MSGRRSRLVLDDGELVDRQKLVVLRVVEIEHPHQVAADRAVGPLILDRHAFDEVAVDHVVVRDERRRIGPGELAEGLLDGVGRHMRIEPLQGLPQPPFQNDLAIVVPLGRRLAGGDLRPGAMPPYQRIRAIPVPPVRRRIR